MSTDPRPQAGRPVGPLGRARGVRVWIPETVLGNVDDEAERRGLSRSRAIVEALEGWLDYSVCQPSDDAYEDPAK